MCVPTIVLRHQCKLAVTGPDIVKVEVPSAFSMILAKAVLMANLSSYGSDILSEVSISNNNIKDMLNQSMQEMQYSEPSHFVEHLENKIHSDSNIIPYS
nr:hypothetical protein [Tanacetum cinerariifolium]